MDVATGRAHVRGIARPVVLTPYTPISSSFSLTDIVLSKFFLSIKL